MLRMSQDEVMAHALENADMAPFTYFNIDVPLEGGRSVPLWRVRPTNEEWKHSQARRDRVELYESRVMAGLTPFDGDWAPPMIHTQTQDGKEIWEYADEV